MFGLMIGLMTFAIVACTWLVFTLIPQSAHDWLDKKFERFQWW